jgi:hypothetical protein
VSPAVERLRAEIHSDRDAVFRWFDQLAGLDFHKALLDAAALSIEGVRPPLLSPATVTALHDLRAFRHFVRHAYAVDLDAGRLADLQRRAAVLRPALTADLDRLDRWLSEIARSYPST